jgi:uncharacterized PurR-regulated membrane protein YhhQ (DUF165 family)
MSQIFDTLVFISGNRGPGFLIILIALAFIILFDKIVKLIVFVIDKFKEMTNRKKD